MQNLNGLLFCLLYPGYCPGSVVVFLIYQRHHGWHEFRDTSFVDECACYCQIHGIENTIKLQSDIDRLGKWAKKWGMRFQPIKCNVMQLTRQRINRIIATYTTVLEKVDRIKYLKYLDAAGGTLISVISAQRQTAGLGSSVGCALDWWSRGREFAAPVRQHSFVEIDHEIFSTVILSLPLIQEGKLSVTCGRMCTEYWLTA